LFCSNKHIEQAALNVLKTDRYNLAVHCSCGGMTAAFPFHSMKQIEQWSLSFTTLEGNWVIPFQSENRVPFILFLHFFVSECVYLHITLATVRFVCSYLYVFHYWTMSCNTILPKIWY